MPLSTESSSVSLSADHAPLTRPRPRYFDAHRYSGSGSSHASTSELVPPNTSCFSCSPRGSVGSSHSLSALNSPFLDANRPLSLGHNYTLPVDVSSWGVELDPDAKEADDDIHNPDWDFIVPTISSAHTSSALDRLSIASLPFLTRFRKSEIGSEDDKASSAMVPEGVNGVDNEKALGAGTDEITLHHKRHRTFRVERDNNFRTWRAFTNLGSLIILMLGLIMFL
ncbi:hypothetical protein BC835DRAFT_360289 [Cytidiella melzeri]|nr:hypothetical protein BC835DRAFT_360289 [Cytidiella melzeri]